MGLLGSSFPISPLYLSQYYLSPTEIWSCHDLWETSVYKVNVGLSGWLRRFFVVSFQSVCLASFPSESGCASPLTLTFSTCLHAVWLFMPLFAFRDSFLCLGWSASFFFPLQTPVCPSRFSLLGDLWLLCAMTGLVLASIITHITLCHNSCSRVSLFLPFFPYVCSLCLRLLCITRKSALCRE